MKNDLSIVFKYIKSYKARSLAIILSIVLGTALIVGVGTLSRSAQQADVDRMKRECGNYHVRFKDINKEQLDIVKQGNDIKDISMTSNYASTDLGEKLPINIQRASENYLKKDSKLLKGRYPKGKNEVVVEKWILNCLGLDPNINQEITFKLYEKEKPETFKVVGILSDRYSAKSVGICEMFTSLDESSSNKFDTYVEFNEKTDILKNINNISKEAKFSKEDNIRVNKELVSSITTNGVLDQESKNTAIVVSLFAGFVMYSIYSISIYQRIREYGVLKALGSTNFKIFKFMIYELVMLSFISLPIGILIGMGGAQIFNKLSGNVKFEIKGVATPFVIPIKVIILATGCILLVSFIISILTYIKIARVSTIDAIRKNLNNNKKVQKNNFIANKLSKYIPVTKSVSMRNIFRDKGGLIIIILSMSIGGLMIVRDNYTDKEYQKRMERFELNYYNNGDFILTSKGSYNSNSAISKEQINEIKSIDGIKEVKTASILQTRMDIPKEKFNDLNYYKEKEENAKRVGKGHEILENKEKNTYTIQQQIKGYNDEMIKSLDNYVVSGKIDINKMKNNNEVVLYIPHTFSEGSYSTTIIDGGKPAVDIKVGDTVKVKYPKGKMKTRDDESNYWFMKDGDNYDYEYCEFKVGAIVDYPFADNCLYSWQSGIDIITSNEYMEKITGINTYDLVYANIKDGANYEDINKKLGKIGSKTAGTTTKCMIKEKEIDKQSDKKENVYRYGIIAIIFTISMFNIINNVSYNITSRTSEFGMLRAVGISNEDFRKMIIYEGLLYGVLSSVAVIVIGILMQIRIYNTWGFEYVGLEFEIAYMDYILISIANILIGLFATYIPARKIKESNIVESINIVE
ncbi:ABC transporter permease [Romboutsia lituseburensis]|uniref:ABC-type transport system, involved in lipoprotein release, permease component n=1 Tax=Romboutsia lituseburensis DSM 797 TaxID=1121325 RepID=A0A1G9LEU5_9FIRM|nr:ABC transporter permease [Romboutsia lituseburensis]CEH35278.1 ABC transporter, permease protein [Romboutsia lituseburensis]SDL60303.1 ABC-type transport system, involved in lipoprotein release, permease component [Romboutsia lituseburensis DSM 797]